MTRKLTMKPVDLLCCPTSTFLKNLFYRIFWFGLFAGWVESWTKAIRLSNKKTKDKMDLVFMDLENKKELCQYPGRGGLRISFLSHARNMMNMTSFSSIYFRPNLKLTIFTILCYKSIYPNLTLLFNLSSLKVLGEYSYTASEYEPRVILEQLFSLLERKFEGKNRNFTCSCDFSNNVYSELPCTFLSSH